MRERLEAFTEQQFAHWARDALRHLYDGTYLAKHPLLDALAIDPEGEGAGRAKMLRLWLLDAIESLRPEDGTPSCEPAWRRYNILVARYVESRSTLEAMQQVSLAHSRYHEEHRAALDAFVAQFRERLARAQENHASGPLQAGGRSMLGREITRVGTRQDAEVVQVAEVLDDVLAMLAPIAAKRGLQIRGQESWQPSSPEIRTNKVLLRQLLIQLLGNAVRLAVGGHITLNLSQEATALEIGLTMARPPAEVGHIVDQTTQELAISLGADIHESCRRDIAHLRLRLGQTRRRLALLIDNDRELGALFQRYLLLQNWDLIAGQDASEGLRLAAQSQPDLIILDVIMPGRDGWDVLSQLRNDEPTHDMPIIVCSVMEQPELALRLGADLFLPKPVDQLTFLQALHRFYPSHSSHPAPQT